MSSDFRAEDVAVFVFLGIIIGFLIGIAILSASWNAIAEQICEEMGKELLEYQASPLDFEYVICGEPSSSFIKAVG